MKKQFDNLRATRDLLKKVTKDLSLEELNKVPDGYNNNIAWNVCHIVVTQQLLVYSLSGLQPNISNDLISLFRKGSSPNGAVTAETMKVINEKMDTLIHQTYEDYQNGVFKSYKEYPTSYGITLNSVEEAIDFNNMHEALHLGYVMAMKRAL
jgi:hypothetical protein